MEVTKELRVNLTQEAINNIAMLSFKSNISDDLKDKERNSAVIETAIKNGLQFIELGLNKDEMKKIKAIITLIKAFDKDEKYFGSKLDKILQDLTMSEVPQ